MKIIDKITMELIAEGKKITENNILKKVKKLSFAEREQYDKEFCSDFDDDSDITDEDKLCTFDEDDIVSFKKMK